MNLRDLARLIDDVHASTEPSLLRLDAGGFFRSRIAVLPSAYNPPTRAHVELLRAAGAVEGVGSVAALLTTRNVAKGLHGASLAHRAGMLMPLRTEGLNVPVLVTNQARIADQAQLLAETWPGVGVDMVVGYDTLVRVFDRQYYVAMHDELAAFFASHRLIAANRDDHGARELAQFLERPEVLPFAERILVARIGDEAARLSSTAARDAVAAGREPHELPDEVRAYIARHGLYAEA